MGILFVKGIPKPQDTEEARSPEFAEKVKQAVAKTVQKKLGNASLNQLAKVLRAAAASSSRALQAVRTQVITAIDDDIQHILRTHPDDAEAEIDKMIQKAMATPEYVALLRDLGMDESHLRAAKIEALQKRSGGK